MPKTDAIEVITFDLDNTLYPASCDLFEQVRVRIAKKSGEEL